jgi:hypothetical protein
MNADGCCPVVGWAQTDRRLVARSTGKCDIISYRDTMNERQMKAQPTAAGSPDQ